MFIKSKKFTGVVYHLLQNKDKSYYIIYKLQGKVHKVHIGKRSEGITEAFCHQMRNDAINRAKFGDDSPVVRTKVKRITFDDLAQSYLAYHKLHNKDYTNTLSRYTRHIEPILGNKSILDINMHSIERIQREKIDFYAPKTINHIVQLIGTIYNHAIRQRSITIENPVHHVRKLKVNNERLRYLSRKEVHYLLREVKYDEQLYLFVLLALQTGGRLSSITNIKKKDIDTENKIISIQDYKNDSFYKGFFTAPLSTLLSKLLPRMNIDMKILGYACTSTNLQVYISKKLQPILNTLFNKNLAPNDRRNRVVIHTLRHTFASHLAINGTPIFTIQKLMNHKDINMTLRYAKLSPDSGKDFVKKLYK